MDNYKIVEITITYCFWSDANSSYTLSSKPEYRWCAVCVVCHTDNTQYQP